MISLKNDDLYNNITNNKVYLDIPAFKYEQKMQEIILKKDYNDIFKNMSLQFIKGDHKNINITLLDNNRNLNNDIKEDKRKINKNNIKYDKDSFITELSKLLMKNNREIKNEIKEYVNSEKNLEYIKSLTRSYKKYIINIHNLLVNENIDNVITDEFVLLLCKIYNINLIIYKEDFYKKYEIEKSMDTYVFEKYTKNIKSNKLVNYKLLEDINEIDKFLKNKKEYLENKIIKNMKVEELKKLAINNNILSTQKKAELVEQLINKYNRFN